MPDRLSPRRPRGARLGALLAATAALLGSALIVAPAAHAVPATSGTLSLTADADVTVGDTVSVTLTSDAVTDLYAYDLVLGYDPALLQIDSSSAVFPAGGFESVAATAGVDAVTVTHTRLGSSPGLVGAQTLVTVSFTALAAGSADITLLSGTMIGTAGESTAITAELSTTTTVAAAPTTPPVSGGETGDGTGTENPATGTTDTTAGDGRSGDLASTGVDASPWIATAVLGAGLIALGTVLVLRRREATR